LCILLAPEQAKGKSLSRGNGKKKGLKKQYQGWTTKERVPVSVSTGVRFAVWIMEGFADV